MVKQQPRLDKRRTASANTASGRGWPERFANPVPPASHRQGGPWRFDALATGCTLRISCDDSPAKRPVQEVWGVLLLLLIPARPITTGG